jgi:hypothetical protein
MNLTRPVEQPDPDLGNPFNVWCDFKGISPPGEIYQQHCSKFNREMQDLIGIYVLR